jgi:hypothetical protein
VPYNIHLVIVPFFERHTANYVKLLATILDAMYTGWRDKLISVSSDGENTVTGRHGDVVNLLEQQCNNRMLRIWCPAHQLDLVVKRVPRDLDGCWLCRPTDQDSNVESKECLAFFRMLLF